MTCLPDEVHRATADEAPYSMSSGWATTARAVVQSSGNGSRSSEGTSALCMPDILSAPSPFRPVGRAGPGGAGFDQSVRIYQSSGRCSDRVASPLNTTTTSRGGAAVAEIQVHLVAVERELWQGSAQMVVARTVDGDIGVMAGHSPLLAQLREGFAARIIEPDGNVLGVAVHGGFLSVTKDGVTILAEDAQLSDEIDVTKARAAYDRARAQGTNSAEAEADLRRARAQLLAVGESI